MTRPAEADVLRSDYGGFNPRFIGVSYLFDSFDDYEVVQDYLTGPDVPARTGGEAPSLHRIALTSVADHESRHYVDFLLSPYSMTVFRMRLQGLLNGVQAVNTMRHIEGDAVPVPLTRWATLADAERQTRAADWADLFGEPVRPVTLPARTRDDLLTDLPHTVEPISHLPAQEQFERHADSAMRAYARIGQLTEGFDVPASRTYLRPPYLHEVSAYTVQLAAVWSGQGMAEFGQLMSFLLDSEAPQAQAFRICLRLAQLLEPPADAAGMEATVLLPLRRIPSITTWALLGNYRLDGPRGCPSSRLIRLIEAVTSSPDPSRWSGDMGDAASISHMWDRWDRQIGVTSWRTGLHQNLTMTGRGAAQYERVRDLWPGSDEILGAVIGVLRQVAADQQLVTRTLLRDLAAFVDPFRYVHIPAAGMPHPDVRFEFRGFGVRPDAIRAGSMIQRQGRDGTPYAAGVAYTLRDDPTSRALLDQKLTIEQVIEWCDLAFSELSVPDHVHLSARAGLENLTGKQILQLV